MNKTYYYHFFAMGTRFDLVIPLFDEKKGEYISHAIEKEILRIEKKLSYFDTSSKVYQINMLAAQSPVQLDEELWKVLSEIKTYNLKTLGLFDITLRPCIENLKNNLPTSELIKELGYDKIIFDENNFTISFNNKSVKIDFGGYGKGYALAKVNKILNDYEVENAFISFGESSILTRGSHPYADNWEVGIKDFYDKENPAYVFRINNGSVSTSSNFLLNDNHNMKKIISTINPLTGNLIDAKTSVSVSTSSAIDAEVLSTSILLAEEDQISEILNNFNETKVVKISYNEKNERDILTFQREVTA